MPDEVRVEDPTHPLYGKRFRVHSIERGIGGPRRRHALVWYEDETLLRIPLDALTPSHQAADARTKLTAESIGELVDRACSFGLIDLSSKIALVVVFFVSLLWGWSVTSAGATPLSHGSALSSVTSGRGLFPASEALLACPPGMMCRTVLEFIEVDKNSAGGTRARSVPERKFSGSLVARCGHFCPMDCARSNLARLAAGSAAVRDRRSDCRGAGGAR